MAYSIAMIHFDSPCLSIPFTLSSSTFSFENENETCCSHLFRQELTQEILQLVQDVSGLGESSPLDVGDKMVRHSQRDMRRNIRAVIVVPLSPSVAKEDVEFRRHLPLCLVQCALWICEMYLIFIFYFMYFCIYRMYFVHFRCRISPRQRRLAVERLCFGALQPGGSGFGLARGQVHPQNLGNEMAAFFFFFSWELNLETEVTEVVDQSRLKHHP